MSEGKPDLLRVPALEADIVRLFAIDTAAVPALLHQAASDGYAGFLAAQFGLATLSPDCTDLIDLSDLGEQGLEDYLVEGQGIPAQALFADIGVVAGLKGHVLVVTSAAFGGAEAALSMTEGLKPVGAWAREGAEPPRLILPANDRPLATASPKGQHARFAAPWIVALLLTLVCGAFALRYAL